MLQEGEQDIFQQPTWQPEALRRIKRQSSAWLHCSCHVMLCHPGRGVPTESHPGKPSLLPEGQGRGWGEASV